MALLYGCAGRLPAKRGGFRWAVVKEESLALALELADGTEITPGFTMKVECRGAWARVTVGRFRRLALQTF